MNYILQLQQENTDLKDSMRKADEMVEDFFRYINSEKFKHGSLLDGYVNIGDIGDRLRLIRSELMI